MPTYEEEMRRRQMIADQKEQQAAYQAALKAYTPTPPSQESQLANQQSDEAAAMRYGQTQWKENKWKGRGLIGGPVAAIINRRQKSDKVAGYEASERTRLTSARKAARLKGDRKSMDKARIAAYDARYGVTDRQSDQRHARRQQTDRQAYEGGKVKFEQYEKAGGGTDHIATDDYGRSYTIDANGNRTPTALTGRVVDDTATGSSTPAKKYANEQMETRVNKVVMESNLMQLFWNPLFERSTGMFDIEAQISEGLPLTPEMEEIQYNRTVMDNVKINAIAPLLELLGPKPTDFDAKLAMEGVPTKHDSPHVWFKWMKNSFLVRARAYGMEKISMGESDLTRDQVNANVDNLIKQVEAAEKAHKIRNSTPEQRKTRREFLRNKIAEAERNL